MHSAAKVDTSISKRRTVANIALAIADIKNGDYTSFGSLDYGATVIVLREIYVTWIQDIDLLFKLFDTVKYIDLKNSIALCILYWSLGTSGIKVSTNISRYMQVMTHLMQIESAELVSPLFCIKNCTDKGQIESTLLYISHWKNTLNTPIKAVWNVLTGSNDIKY
jgi:hypothetical protein